VLDSRYTPILVVRKPFRVFLYSWEYGLPLGCTSVPCRCQKEILRQLYEGSSGGAETTNVYVNLEGDSFRHWCLGIEEVASKYLYIARIKFDLLGRGACLILLAMLNICVVLPKDHNADNKLRIHDYTLSLLMILISRFQE